MFSIFMSSIISLNKLFHIHIYILYCPQDKIIAEFIKILFSACFLIPWFVTWMMHYYCFLFKSIKKNCCPSSQTSLKG